MNQHLPLASTLPTQEADSHLMSAKRRTTEDLSSVKSQNDSKAIPTVGAA